jgi:phosphoribosyl 1,2-cyclic phosphodiesterase
MKVTIWGSRGSIACAGADTIRYGGNTSSVQVDGPDGSVIVLDAGTGVRMAGAALARDGRPVHVLLTHLHMDHIQGLGFFRPLFDPGREIHIWGPPSTTQDLRTRLTRYLSPPLFPVRIRDVEADLELHDVPIEPWRIGGFDIAAASIIHPGPTVGYRIAANGSALAYLPDHEPALGGLSSGPAWTSGFDLMRGVDVLLHDGQYTEAEYAERMGWGHSTAEHAIALADLAGVDRLVLFHHDPEHDDPTIDSMVAAATTLRRMGDVVAGAEGMTFEI